MFKLFVLLGLVTGCCVGQTLLLDAQDGEAGAVRDSSLRMGVAENLDSAGRQHRALETLGSLISPGVVRILERNSDGFFKESDDPRAIVFSVVDQANQETRIAVDRDLVLKYSNLLRDIGTFDNVIPVSSDSSHFITLFDLLSRYDQNPTAYQNGQRFEIDPANVFGVLRAANFLFARNDLKSSDEWVPTNDLGFFHALLNSCGPVIFDPLFSLQKRDAEGNLVLPLPYDIYHAALPFADASDVSAFSSALENLNRVDALSGLDQRLLLMLLRPTQKQSALWRRLKAEKNLNEHDSKLLDSLGERFTEWSDFQPNQPVLQGNIVVSPTELENNMGAIDAFFAQNPDKTLVVDFGNATGIGDFFTVPQSIKRLIVIGEQITTVGDNFLYSCKGLTKLNLSGIPLETVGHFFLCNCTGLMALTLPQNLKTVGDYFLAYCSGLRTLDLSGIPLTRVGDGFLFNSTGLTALTLPQSLTSVGHDFLRNCNGLTALALPQSLTAVGHDFLRNCTGLTALALPQNLTRFGDYFLCGCSGLTALALPQNLTRFGAGFLLECSGLRTLILSQAQEEILRGRIDLIKSINPLLSVTIEPEARQQAVH